MNRWQNINHHQGSTSSLPHLAKVRPSNFRTTSVPNVKSSSFLVKKVSPKSATNEQEDLIVNEIKDEDVNDIIDSNMVLDVLPSFELYNSLHGHIPRQNLSENMNSQTSPPSYNQTELEDRAASLSPQISRILASNATNHNTRVSNNHNHIDSITHPSYSRHSSDETVIHSMNNSAIHSARDSMSSFTVSNIEDGKKSSIDSIYSLPKANLPIQISVNLTQVACIPPLKPKPESVLKEYTSGETIHGYVTIKNTSKIPIAFDMFYVTLEGYTYVMNTQKKKKILKRFLRMTDISASWCYTGIELGSGLKVEYGSKDYDNSVLGLDDDRVLKPGKEYKKFLMFKLPNQLLDNTCSEGHFSHTLLPPSFGIDKHSEHGKFSNIRVKPLTGYGYSESMKSPLLTEDLSGETISINYSVDARFVGDDPKHKIRSILSECSHPIRVIPFGFQHNLSFESNSKTQLVDLRNLLQDRFTCLDKVFEKLSNNLPIESNDIIGYEFDEAIPHSVDLANDNTQEYITRKMNQLYVKNRTTSTQDKIMSEHVSILSIEDSSIYNLKPKSTLLSGIFANSNKTNPGRSGTITVSTAKPRKSLPYHSPISIREYNAYENRTRTSKENWDCLKLRNNEEPLREIKLKLTCTQANNSNEHEPPIVEHIRIALVVVTISSPSSIPLNINNTIIEDNTRLHDIVYEFGKLHEKIENYRSEFKTKKPALNELFNSNIQLNPDNADQIRELNFVDFISDSLHKNIESLAKLKIEKTELNNVFKKQKPSINTNHSDNTSHINHTTKHFPINWTKSSPHVLDAEIPLKLEFADELLTTLVPDFEHCLCSRFYYIKIRLLFNHMDPIVLNIPISIKNFI